MRIAFLADTLRSTKPTGHYTPAEAAEALLKTGALQSAIFNSATRITPGFEALVFKASRGSRLSPKTAPSSAAL